MPIDFCTEYAGWQPKLLDWSWSAHRADYRAGMPIGFGRSEAAAIADLLNKEAQS